MPIVHLPTRSISGVVSSSIARLPVTAVEAVVVRPDMAQSAEAAIEDAAVLARCLNEVDGDDIPGAFRRYEAHRKPRTSRIQAISSANTWMRTTEDNPDWLYGYDAWNVELPEVVADCTTLQPHQDA